MTNVDEKSHVDSLVQVLVAEIEVLLESEVAFRAAPSRQKQLRGNIIISEKHVDSVSPL